MSVNRKLAPLDNNKSKQSTDPLNAAKCNGVLPPISLESIRRLSTCNNFLQTYKFYLKNIKEYSTSIWPAKQLRCNAVRCSVLRAAGDAPHSNKVVVKHSWPNLYKKIFDLNIENNC